MCYSYGYQTDSRIEENNVDLKVRKLVFKLSTVYRENNTSKLHWKWITQRIDLQMPDRKKQICM